MFKLFLDDIRDAPDSSWIIVRDPKQFTRLLSYLGSQVTHISLDHDLGQDDQGNNLMTGYDVLVEIEKWVASPKGYDLRMDLDINVHSANPVGRDNMQKAITSIKRLMKDSEIPFG